MAINHKRLVGRAIALKAILNIKQGTRFKEGLTKAGFEDLLAEARPFVLFIVSETIRYYHVCAKIIDEYLQKKPQKKSLDFIYAILSLGICEIIRSDQNNQLSLSLYTDIAKSDKKTIHLAGIVRAILGKVHDNKQNLQGYFEQIETIFSASFLSTLKKDYGDDYEKIAKALLVEASTDITLLTQIPLIEGYDLLSSHSMRLRNGARPENLGIFKDGDINIQSFASYLVLHCLPLSTLGTHKNKRLIDFCAAPGGKSLQAASMGFDVTAVDISNQRMLKLKENIERTNCDIEIMISDALDYKPPFKADVILLDLPCSATGTIRKNPDLIMHYDNRHINDLVKLQKNILDHAKDYLADNGILVYAVCSLDKREGEQQIQQFLNDNKDFSIISPEKCDAIPQGALTTDNMIRLLPYHDTEKGGHDGFFVAYLRRLNS